MTVCDSLRQRAIREAVWILAVLSLAVMTLLHCGY